MQPKNSVEFVWAENPLDVPEDGKYIYVIFKTDGIEIARKFAPWKLDCYACIIDWMYYSKVTVKAE